MTLTVRIMGDVNLFLSGWRQWPTHLTYNIFLAISLIVPRAGRSEIAPRRCMPGHFRSMTMTHDTQDLFAWHHPYNVLRLCDTARKVTLSVYLCGPLVIHCFWLEHRPDILRISVASFWREHRPDILRISVASFRREHRSDILTHPHGIVILCLYLHCKHFRMIDVTQTFLDVTQNHGSCE